MASQERDPARERRWREAIAAQAASGLSVRDYCRGHGLAEPSFYHWRRKLRSREGRPASPRFVPVTVVAAAPAVEVRCPSGHVVTVPNADATTLRHLFAALAEGPPC